MITMLLILLLRVLGDLGGSAGTVTMKVEDALTHSRILKIGVHPDATYGYDKAFAEVAIPPIPVVPVFDARLVDLPNRPRFPGTGTRIDIRGFRHSTQSDTFIVKFQPAEGKYPITISWTSDIERRFEKAVMQYQSEGGRKEIDMGVVHSFMVSRDDVTRVLVILARPKTQHE